MTPITRRAFGIGALPLWLARAASAASGKRKVLVAVFQRGAMDGLNAVIPHGEKRYAELRPTLAIPRADALDLDGFFSLHPALKPLYPLWQSKDLAAIHATGSPDPTRCPSGKLHRTLPRGLGPCAR